MCTVHTILSLMCTVHTILCLMCTVHIILCLMCTKPYSSIPAWARVKSWSGNLRWFHLGFNSYHGKTQSTGCLTIARQEKPKSQWWQTQIWAINPIMLAMGRRKNKSSQVPSSVYSKISFVKLYWNLFCKALLKFVL